jgi:hypothetical protein
VHFEGNVGGMLNWKEEKKNDIYFIVD